MEILTSSRKIGKIRDFAQLTVETYAFLGAEKISYYFAENWRLIAEIQIFLVADIFLKRDFVLQKYANLLLFRRNSRL